MIPVSVLVVTKNAASGLAATLESLGGFSEVIAVDSHSADGTADIAASYNVPVVQFQWNGQYPKKRQWVLDHVATRFDWIFFVDADEIITEELKQEISKSLGSDKSSFFVRGQPVFCNKPLKFGRWNNKIVLFRKHCVYYPEFPDTHTEMGEIEGHYQPRVSGAVGQLKSPLIHRCADDFGAWIARHRRYASWLAEMEIMGVDFSVTENGLRKAMKKIFVKLPLRPFAAFIDSYVLKKGALDGKPGFHYAIARAFFYWMVDASKVASSKKVSDISL